MYLCILHLQVLIVIWHVDPLRLGQIDVLSWAISFCITTRLCPLGWVNLLDVAGIRLLLSIRRRTFVALVSKLLRISDKVWIWLNFFSLSWSSSWLILIHIELHTLATSTRSSWSWACHSLFRFHLTRAYIGIHLLVLGWRSSLSCIGTLVLALVMLL